MWGILYEIFDFDFTLRLQCEDHDALPLENAGAAL
jgi:hypothetical protein